MRQPGLMVAMPLVLVVGFACAAAAQEQTGAIQGVVKDSSGAVLPGVTVEARNVSAAGFQTAVTSGLGVYRFPALPPGVYDVTATLEGFTPGKIVSAAIGLGTLLTVDFSLAVGGMTVSVQVTGDAPLIDVKQNASFATIRQAAIERMPKGRDFTTILKTAPGAQAELKAGGEAQVDGASGCENRFVIDGMDTSSIRDGRSGKPMPIDFIQEVQVKSSGYDAEFGGALGGVVNAITKSGTNAWRGQVGGYLQSSRFYGAKRNSPGYDAFNTNLAIASRTFPDPGWLWVNPVADLGGPIVRGRLWWYAGYSFARERYNVDATFYGDPRRVERHFRPWATTHDANANLATQITNALRLKLSVSSQRYGQRESGPSLVAERYVFPDGTTATTPYTTNAFDKNADGSVNDAAFESRWVKQGSNSSADVYAGTLDWVATPTIFVNGSGGFYRKNSTTPPEFRSDQIAHVFSQANGDAYMAAQGYPTVPAAYQQAAGYADNASSNGSVRYLFTRAFFNGSLTHVMSLAGQHTWKAGVRVERLGNDMFLGYARPVVTLFWGQPFTNQDTGQVLTGKYGYYSVAQTGAIGKIHSNNYAVWLQDRWSPNARLTVNAGVRAERETLPSFKKAADAMTVTFGFRDKIAPRVGFAYDVTGSGTWKAYGSYGHFFDITKANLLVAAFGGGHSVYYYWTLDTYDFSSIQCGEGTSGCPGTFIGSVDGAPGSNQSNPVFAAYFNRPGMTGIDPGMKPVQGRELTAGLDHELTPTTSIALRYVHKWLIRTIEDVGIFVNGAERYLVGNPGEHDARIMEPLFPSFPTPRPRRVYDSVELRLTRRLSRRWAGDVSYLWSRLWGNYSGLASSDEGNKSTGGRTDPNATRYFDNTIQNYDTRGQSVLGRLPTDRPHQLKVSGSYDVPWGTQVGAFFTIQSGTPLTSVVRFSGYPVFVNGRGDLGRSPVFSQLDLQATQVVTFAKRYRVAFTANVDNVFDQKTWTNYFSPTLYGPEPYRNSITLAMPPDPANPASAAVLYSPYDVASIVAWSRNRGATVRDNALYKAPGVFQDRRQIRLSARVSF